MLERNRGRFELGWFLMICLLWPPFIHAHVRHLGVWTNELVPSDFGGWATYSITTDLAQCVEFKRRYGLARRK